MADKRRKTRVDIMNAAIGNLDKNKAEVEKKKQEADPQFKKDQEKVQKQAQERKKVIQVLKADEFEQKDSLQKRLALRKLRQKKKKADQSMIDIDNTPSTDKDKEYYHRGGAQSVLFTKQSDLSSMLDRIQMESDDVPTIIEDSDDE